MATTLVSGLSVVEPSKADRIFEAEVVGGVFLQQRAELLSRPHRRDVMMITQVPPLPPIPTHSTMSMTAFVIAAATVLLFPFVVALAIRIMRRPAPPALASQWQGGPERLDRLEQAVDAIALEVERISEGQRFLTKLLTDKAGVPVGAARALDAGDEPAVPGS